MVNAQEEGQAVRQLFAVKVVFEILLFGFNFNRKQQDDSHAEENHCRSQNVIGNAGGHISFVKINDRFGDAARRARKPGEHFKRAKRLVAFKMVITVVEHQKKRYHQCQ